MPAQPPYNRLNAASKISPCLIYSEHRALCGTVSGRMSADTVFSEWPISQPRYSQYLRAVEQLELIRRDTLPASA